MATSVYVGNLPYSASEEELSQLFAQAGTVVGVRLPTERDSGRPRGFGFVEMSSQEEAENAAKMFNGYHMGDRDLRVNMAEDRPQRGGGRPDRY